MLRLLALLLSLGASLAHAVVGVHPFGVNVRSSGPTSVFLTFQALDAGELPVEAFWCGELQGALMAANPGLQAPFAVQVTDPCLPGTVYGRLPLRLDRSRTSAAAGLANLSDVMTIPASVARRAYQDAAAGLHSAFFYVRRFAGPAGERYVIVTCRMAGGGARSALALLDVRLAFDTGARRATVLAVPRGVAPPPAELRLLYNGSGTLRGRWEVVQPGDAEPGEDDLLTEATLPVELRARQRRYAVVERFEHFLPPTGAATLPGPDPARLPVDVEGPYKLLLRIEASDDKEASSDTGAGRLALAGGVAGFAMPVLRYHVGAPEAFAAARDAGGEVPVAFAPAPGAVLQDRLDFAWADAPGARLVRLELRDGDEEVLAAFVAPGTGAYTAPPWFVQAQRGRWLRWRVLALDERGEPSSVTDWRAFELR